MAKRFLALAGALVLLTGAAIAQEAGDGDVAVSSTEGPAAAAAAFGDAAFSPANAGADITVGDDALATMKASAETADDVWALWALAPLSADIGIESIIPPDERTKVTNTTVYPQRAMVLLTTSSGRCSGTMISPNTVLTAGHCVHGGGSAGAWATNVRVFPGRNGAQSPFGSCGSRTLYSVLGWVRDRNELYDYGVVKLDCTIGNTVGWLGLRWQTASLVGVPTIIEGYPGDKPLEQWHSAGPVRVSDNFQIFYQDDTMPGNSGSSVYTMAFRAACGGPCVIGVHAYGLHGSPPHGDNNHGVRVTKPVFDNLIAWMNAP